MEMKLTMVFENFSSGGGGGIGGMLQSRVTANREMLHAA